MEFSGSITINRETPASCVERAPEGVGLIAGKKVQIFLDVETDLVE